jgi:hypothetical protein
MATAPPLMINSAAATPPSTHNSCLMSNPSASFTHTKTAMASSVNKTEEFGQNDDFWLFGYGYVHALCELTAT